MILPSLCPSVTFSSRLLPSLHHDQRPGTRLIPTSLLAHLGNACLPRFSKWLSLVRGLGLGMQPYAALWSVVVRQLGINFLVSSSEE